MVIREISINKPSALFPLTSLLVALCCVSCTWAFAPISSRTFSNPLTNNLKQSYYSNQHVLTIHSNVLQVRPNNLYATESSSSQSSSTSQNEKIYKPIFDFMDAMSDIITSNHPINKFERIDDAIMGGISTSSVRFVPNQPYCSWSGVCRTFGGGFCGMRTLPFLEPLQVGDGIVSDNGNSTFADGLFVRCRLASDNEPERRVWKMTIRTDTSRGELVYQSSFQLPKSTSTEDEWKTIHVPFNSFQQVRGPRIVPNGETLDLSGGIFQIGMTMSKFQMGMNTTEIDNFREGYFELQIKQIGLYFESDMEKDIIRTDNAITKTIVQTLTKEEMIKKRSPVFKLLIAVSKIFFSEKANRRKSAMNILRNQRKMTRMQAIIFGLRNRSKSIGRFRSAGKTISILAIDTFRTVAKTFLKVVFVYPLQILRKALKFMKKSKKEMVKS